MQLQIDQRPRAVCSYGERITISLLEIQVIYRLVFLLETVDWVNVSWLFKLGNLVLRDDENIP